MNGDAGGVPLRVGTTLGDLSATIFAGLDAGPCVTPTEGCGSTRRRRTDRLGDRADRDRRRRLHGLRHGCWPAGNPHALVRPYELFPCKDGQVFFGGYTDKLWRINLRDVRTTRGRR